MPSFVPRLLLVAACLCGLAGPSFAETPSAGTAADHTAPVYPLTVRIQLGAPVRSVTFQHLRGSGLSAPANPDAWIPLGEQAFVAYALLGHRLFRQVQGGAADAELEVLAIDPGLRLDALGWRAEVTHQVVLRDAAGVELGRWTVSGEARVEGPGPGALPLAFSRAAKAAAARLEHGFEVPPGVAAWLLGSGVAPGRAVLAAPPPPIPVAPLVTEQPGAPRGGLVATLDAALGLSTGAAPGWEPGLRGGLSTPTYFVQVGLTSLAGTTPAPRGASYSGLLVGLDAGALIRLARALELRAGAGVGRVSASQAGASGARACTAFLVGAQYTTAASAGGGRLRLGLEFRQVIGGSVTLSAPSRPPASLQAVDRFVGLLVGYELPWTWRPGR